VKKFLDTSSSAAKVASVKRPAAAATALYLLNKSKKDESILLFLNDPAHSLSDSLDVKIGNRLVEVKQHRGARLFAYEMDASSCAREVSCEHRESARGDC
jgi:anion-transporting  ArsA/GET3 family ATPase